MITMGLVAEEEVVGLPAVEAARLGRDLEDGLAVAVDGRHGHRNEGLPRAGGRGGGADGVAAKEAAVRSLRLLGHPRHEGARGEGGRGDGVVVAGAGAGEEGGGSTKASGHEGSFGCGVGACTKDRGALKADRSDLFDWDGV